MSVMQTEMASDDNLRMEWDPFSDEQVEGLFFPGAGRGELLEQLQHLARYGSALTVLVGEAGLGKRTLLNQLLQKLDGELFDVADIQADVMMTLEQLLNQLDDAWRALRPFTPDNFLEMVPAVASAADDESKTLLCIVRSAQQLNEEVLTSLQAMLAASAGLPVKCLLLAGVAELENAPVIHRMIGAMPDSHVLYLDPLSQEQVGEYLKYRMHTAGLGQVSFSPQQIESIHRESRGNMARINEIAREVLIEAMPAPKLRASQRERKLPLPLMHVVALVVLLGAILLFWQMEPSHTPVQKETVVLDNAVPVPQPKTPTNEQPAPEKMPAAPANTFEKVAQVAQQGSESAATDVVTKNEVPAPAESLPQQPAKLEQPVTPADASASKVSTPVAAPDLTPAPVPVAPASKPVIAKKELKPVPARDPRETWILGLAPGHYMLQLMGAQERETLDRFLADNPSLKRVAYYQTLRKGKNWYIEVQGDYPDYDAAKAGIDRLPGGLRKENPWIRKVEAVQQEIKSR